MSFFVTLQHSVIQNGGLDIVAVRSDPNFEAASISLVNVTKSIKSTSEFVKTAFAVF